MYGPQETNETDTVYGSNYFDPNKPFAMAIWDSGGTDTIDLSAFTQACTISLVSGTSSTVACTGWAVGQMSNNLGIAEGAIIENIIAGSGNDVIVGNEVANVINGGAGDDSLTGGAGADNFKFGLNFGNDTVTDFAAGSDTLTFVDGSDAAIDVASISASEVSSNLVLTVGSDTVTLDGIALSAWDPSTFIA